MAVVCSEYFCQCLDINKYLCLKMKKKEKNGLELMFFLRHVVSACVVWCKQHMLPLNWLEYLKWQSMLIVAAYFAVLFLQ